jgi:hypothetical protein
MLHAYEIADKAALTATKAAYGTLDDLRRKRVRQEPAFTDRMLGRIAQEMDGYEVNGVTWSATTATDRASGAQEARYGADFMGVLHIDVPGYQVSHGFLAQAKLVEPDKGKDTWEYVRMRGQCETMLQFTNESFIFLYSENRISVVPAISIIAAEPCNPHKICSVDLFDFFKNHFESFIGDIRLDDPDITLLDELDEKFLVRSTLTMTAKSASAKIDIKRTTPRTFAAD